jgi:hypothetical protein
MRFLLVFYTATTEGFFWRCACIEDDLYPIAETERRTEAATPKGLLLLEVLGR